MNLMVYNIYIQMLIFKIIIIQSKNMKFGNNRIKKLLQNGDIKYKD